ncbi:helix-turn-helix transcriptional regulator [Blautia producta]|nr:helix-turn-helix transcriptional regulator [Blautia producta]NSG17714.1 helix-turn-helix transcriptional regulator [Blautia producta]NSJ77891.1 helix-turn-helix transcriptional regulator [Blautia producta]
MKILLQEYMYNKNLTIRQISVVTKIPKSTISNICNGKRIPRMDTMEELAKGLKVKITDLFDSPYK